MIYFFLILAGFLKAVKDRLDAPRNNYGQYFTSHIMPKEGAFWNKGTGRKFLGYYFDAWHLADTFYILCRKTPTLKGRGCKATLMTCFKCLYYWDYICIFTKRFSFA